MIEEIWSFLSGFGTGWYPLFLGFTAMVETLFPPFPGDVIYVALAGLAARNGLSVFFLWVPGFAGCFASTFLLDSMGRSGAIEKLERLILSRAGKGGVARAKRNLAEKGPWILVLSRFVPGIRSVLVVVAASSGMRRPVVLSYAGLSAVLWYLLMAAAGKLAGAGIESAGRFMSGLSGWLWTALAAAAVAGLAVFFIRKKGGGK